MRVIGITGGLASGKTTLARMLWRRGFVHINADKIVHDLLQHNTQVIAAISAAFPRVVAAKKIDRRKLGELVSHDEAALAILEQVLHPAVRRAEIAAIKLAMRQRRKAVLLDVPLLFETGADDLCDVTIAVAAPDHHRRRRAFLRPHMTPEKYARLIARQHHESERLALADVVIPTSLGKGFTRRLATLWLKELGLL
jgi:dephospho-CoA kinase